MKEVEPKSHLSVNFTVNPVIHCISRNKHLRGGGEFLPQEHATNTFLKQFFIV